VKTSSMEGRNRHRERERGGSGKVGYGNKRIETLDMGKGLIQTGREQDPETSNKSVFQRQSGSVTAGA
jgi:hypothetical protein